VGMAALQHEGEEAELIFRAETRHRNNDGMEHAPACLPKESNERSLCNAFPWNRTQTAHGGNLRAERTAHRAVPTRRVGGSAPKSDTPPRSGCGKPRTPVKTTVAASLSDLSSRPRGIIDRYREWLPIDADTPIV